MKLFAIVFLGCSMLTCSEMVQNSDTRDSTKSEEIGNSSIDSGYILNKRILGNSGFRIGIPSDWKEEIYDNSLVLLVIHKQCVKADIFCPNFVITTYDLEPGRGFSDYIAEYEDIMSLEMSNMKRSSKEEYILKGLETFRRTYTGVKNGVKLDLIKTWVKVNNRLYIMEGGEKSPTDPKDMSYRNLYIDMMNSFELN